MRITIEKRTERRGFFEEKIDYKVIDGDFDEWKAFYGLSRWDKIPENLNPKRYTGDITLFEILQLSPGERETLRDVARWRTDTRVETFVI